MKKLSILALILTAVLATSCGKGKGTTENTEENASAGSSATNTATNTAKNTTNDLSNIPTTIVTDTSTSDVSTSTPSACGGNEDYYTSATVSGTGPYNSGRAVSANFKGRKIIADSKLLVSLKPTSSQGTSGSAGSSIYTQMAVRVLLFKDGNYSRPVASKDISVVDAKGYPSGVKTGAISNPTIVDFSNYLGGTLPPGKTKHEYVIAVEHIRTDAMCRSNCTINEYCLPKANNGEFFDYYSGKCYKGGKWVNLVQQYSYNEGTTVMCCGSDLEQCQSKHCGVSDVTANSAWSLQLLVETDNTTCIPGFNR